MKATVLLSGGVDSTTCLAIAIKKYGRENVNAVSIFYGQRHERELSSAKKISAHYGVNFYEFDAAQVMAYSKSALMNNSSKTLESSTLRRSSQTKSACGNLRTVSQRFNVGDCGKFHGRNF